MNLLILKNIKISTETFFLMIRTVVLSRNNYNLSNNDTCSATTIVVYTNNVHSPTNMYTFIFNTVHNSCKIRLFSTLVLNSFYLSLAVLPKLTSKTRVTYSVTIHKFSTFYLCTTCYQQINYTMQTRKTPSQ